MKKTVYICLLLLVLSCTSREKPYSCKLVELQDLNTFPRPRHTQGPPPGWPRWLVGQMACRLC